MTDSLFFVLIAVVACMYASVGHGGASGYLALMVLVGVSQEIMKPTALLLNVFVSAIAFIQYARRGYFNWKLLRPFILLSIPLTFIGAKIQINMHLNKIILACCLLLAAFRLLGIFGMRNNDRTRQIKFIPALFIGGGIGFISGMIGIGGGIILSPVLLLLYWADIRQASAVAAAFIFLNSVSGIAGALTRQHFTPHIYTWTLMAVFGGVAGGYFGSSRFNHRTLRWVLSLVLLFACTKLVIS